MEASEVIIIGLKYWPHIVFGIAAWFIARMVKGWDESIKDIQSRVCKVEKAVHMAQKTLQASEMILTDWAVMKKGISDAEANFKIAINRLEAIPVLMRDRDAAFRRIDEIREDVQNTEKSMVERCHVLSNRVTAIRSALDSHDINVKFD